MTAPDPRTDLGASAVVAGDALSWTVQVNNPDGTATDLTTIGSAWTSGLRQSASPPSPEIAFAVDASSAATGKLVLSLTGTVTATMCPSAVGRWYFDLHVTGGAVSPQTPFRGALVVYKGIS